MATTFEEVILAFLKADTALAALVSGRIHPDFAPQNEAYPHVTYTLVDMPNPGTLSGPIGMPCPRVQIDCWGNGPTGKADVTAVANAVRNATGSAGTATPRTSGNAKLDGFSGSMGGITIWRVQLVDRRDSNDPPEDGGEVPTRRRSLDFKIAFAES